MIFKKQIKYQRVLLKLSGESLLGEQSFGIDPKALNAFILRFKELIQMGVQVGVVIGGGNIFRGVDLVKSGLSPVTGDQMGMLATVMNALALQDACRGIDLPVLIMSSLPVKGIIEPFNRLKAIKAIEEGTLVIFAGGTGHPYFTTDTTAVLRGLEINADIILKATKVDGVYSVDPKLDSNAKYYTELSYDEVIKEKLRVMDLTAICMCRDNDLPICVFNMSKEDGIKRVVAGESEGTLIRS